MSYSGYSGVDFIKKQSMRDVLFLREIYKVTDDTEIQEIVDILYHDKLNFKQKQKVELFFHKLKKQIGSWYDMLVGMMEHFDMDVIVILENTSLLEKCKAEKIKNRNVNMMELFGGEND